MKKSFLLTVFGVATITVLLGFSSPIFGQDDDGAMLSKAEDLVHQAWNPAGDPPSNDKRIDLLNQAWKLCQDAPQHHVKGHRAQAMLDIRAAIDALKSGDPDNKATELMQGADSELRSALSIAQ